MGKNLRRGGKQSRPQITSLRSSCLAFIKTLISVTWETSLLAPRNSQLILFTTICVMMKFISWGSTKTQIKTAYYFRFGKDKEMNFLLARTRYLQKIKSGFVFLLIFTKYCKFINLSSLHVSMVQNPPVSSILDYKSVVKITEKHALPRFSFPANIQIKLKNTSIIFNLCFKTQGTTKTSIFFFRSRVELL